jgi:hypothetical protein
VASRRPLAAEASARHTVLGRGSGRALHASEDARAVAMALLASGRVTPSQAALLRVWPRGLAAVPASSPGWPASGSIGGRRCPTVEDRPVPHPRMGECKCLIPPQLFSGHR